MSIERACHRTVLARPWLLNGSLEAAERRGVREHLIGCPACRAELARTREALSTFQAARGLTPAAAEPVRATAVATVARPRAPWASVPTLRRLSWAAMIAAVLTSGGATWWLTREGRPTTEAPAAPIQARTPARPAAAPVPAQPQVIFSTGFESGSLASLEAPAPTRRTRRPAAPPARPRSNQISSVDFEGGTLETWQ
jgi:hypothetical protein